MPSQRLTGATTDPVRHGQQGGCERQVMAIITRISRLPAHLTGDQVARIRDAVADADTRRNAR